MAELLVPIAISSQLDVTGEERIHAAPYKVVTREIFNGVAGMSVVKTLVDYDDEDGSGTITVGDVLNYSVIATNTGTLTLHNVVVSDDHFEETEEVEVLPVGESVTLLGSYTVTGDDLIAGEVVNTALAVADELEASVEDVINTPVVEAQLLQFIITNSLGQVAKSADGQNWVLGGNTGTSNELRNIHFDTDRWITTSADDSTAYSTVNGDVWVPHVLTPTCDTFNDLPITKSLDGWFIARNESKAYFSADGSSFSEINVMSGSGSAQAIASNGTVVVAGDNNGRARYTSDGGSSWNSTTVDSGADITDIVWNALAGLWVMTISSSGINVYSSPDLVTWTPRLNVSNRVLGIAHNGTRYVIVGDSPTMIKYSDDLTVWNDATHPFTNSINDVDYDYNNNVWVAVGDNNEVAYSTDGATFVAATSPFASGTILGVAYGDIYY